MLIYLGADHRGYNLKEAIEKFLKEQSYEVIDVGNGDLEKDDDYPDFAKLAARAVSQDPLNRRGILICGSGAGVDIVANKFKGVRSVLAANVEQAKMSRRDDDTNVLSLAAEFINEDEAKEIAKAWLEASFSGEEKHKRRLEKISEIENTL